MKRNYVIIAFAASLLAGGVQAQTKEPKPAAPVEIKRVPPAKPSVREGVPEIEKYPFNQLLRTLGPDPHATSDITRDNTPGQPSMAVANLASDVPADYRAVKDVPLTPVAQAALTVSKGWMTEKQAPAPGPDGRVLYTYGAGLPTVVCAPMRVCIVELEAGEKLSGEPHVGDSVRWVISPAMSGSGRQEVSMLVIKPKQAGLDTTLLVTTDRRAYYLRLVSKPEDYLARVAFAYPEEEVNRWKAHLQDQELRRKEEFEAAQIAPVESLENLYFDYRVTGGDDNMRPVRVLDDGKKTYIQMTSNAAHREAPVLVVVGPNGPEMVNYRVKGDMYIVDRLFERGALILGAGKKSRKAEIIRRTYRGKVEGDPYGSISEGRQ
jgi:P-type conjugative transfer protein TrbG